MNNKPIESWCTGILCKRTPESLHVLADLLSSGIAKGECSANDVTAVSGTAHPNVIGATFKLLRKCGFVQTDKRIPPVAKKKHGRPLYVWELRDRASADCVVQKLRTTLFGISCADDAQGRLAI